VIPPAVAGHQAETAVVGIAVPSVAVEPVAGAVAELVSGVAGHQAETAVVGIAAPSEVVEAAVDVAAEALFVAAEPVVVSVAEPGVLAHASEVVEPVVAVEPLVVFVALVFVAGVAERQASVDIELAFAALVPVSEVPFEVDSPGRPRLLAVPNIEYCSSSSNSVEAVG
jgi:hypothetical protein